MKAKQTTCITRLLGMLFLATGLMTGACTSEMTDDEVTPPAEVDTGRREVLLTLKNKLALPGSATRGIATTAENELSTLDVYVFGSETETGTYTFQERFAYRADGYGPLPLKAQQLPLVVDHTDASKTTGLLGLKKGLYVKLYCIANDTTLIHPATGIAIKANEFKALKLNAAASGVTPTLQTPGVPTETDFLSYHTPLLTAAAPTDVLVTPLTMSGAYTTPIDLTDPAGASRLNIGFKLTRMMTRFGVVNNADESRFTIKSISTGKGRRGATFFPIEVCDAQATVSPDNKLITYPERSFDGAQANQGFQAGAFYSYASPQADGGYLILKGDYQVNATEQKEVTYQVPFRQLAADGTETYLDINHNHRYTIGITKADEYHLDFTLKVEDWADDGSVDNYEPENKPGEIILGAKDTETEYEPDNVSKKHTVKMSLVAGANFEAKITATAMLQVSKTYAGGKEGQQYDWLVIGNPVTTFAAGKSAQVEYTYDFTLTPNYTKGRFPRATIRFFDPISGSESILFVEAISAPTPIETTQPSKAPNGNSPNPNEVDLTQLSISLYRITNSQANVTITCADEVELESKPDWLTVTKTATLLTNTTYSIVLNNRDVADTSGKIVFHNQNKPDLKTEYTINLIEAPILPKFESVGAGNSFTPDVTGTTLGNLTMNVAAGNKATVITTPLDGVGAQINFNGGSEWLTSDATSTRAVVAQRQTVTFSLQEGKLAGAKEATVTLVNKIGGKNEVFTITPKLNVGVIEKVSSLPINNTLSGTTMTLYKLPVATSEMKLKVTSYGGSTLTTDNDNVTVVKTSTTRASNVTQDEVVSYYTLTPNTVGTTQLTLANRTDPAKTAVYTIQVVDSRITVNETTKALITQNGQQTSFTADSPLGFTVENIDYGTSRWINAIATTDYVGGTGKTVSLTANNSSGLALSNIQNVTITLKNKIVNGGDQMITLAPTIITPTFDQSPITLSNIINWNGQSQTKSITSGATYTYAVSSNNTNSVTTSISGTVVTVNARAKGSATVTIKTSSGACHPATFSVTIQRSYGTSGVYYLNGYYIAPYNANEAMYWGRPAIANQCSGVTGNNWSAGIVEQWYAIIGVTGYNKVSTVSSSVLNTIFGVSPYGIWIDSMAGGNTAFFLNTVSSGQFQVNYTERNNYGRVRCISTY